MNLLHDSHPPLDHLAGYSLGKLDDQQTAQIEEHIAACEECARTVVGMPEDTLLELLRGQPTGATGEDQSEPAQKSASANQATLPPASEQATIPPGRGTTHLDAQGATVAFELPPALTEHSRYHLLERLGEGGMGSVYKAEHRIMNRLVALKIINPKLLNHRGAAERFHREVQAAARLSHPNIVTAYDADQAGGLHFLVMEYVEGVDLHQVIQSRGSLPVGEACDYIRQAALGLQHAHDQGMVHRDIKPHNLMLAEQKSGVRGQESGTSLVDEPRLSPRVIKILDFGLASLAGASAEEPIGDDDAQPTNAATPQLTLTGAMMGTPDYIAPEQATDAHSVDIRADIYSLGCTFYCLLAGRAPFHEGTVIDKIMAHADRAAPPLSTYRQDVPAEVEAILAKMMAKNPADRYSQPQALADALALALSGTQQPATLATARGNQRSWLTALALGGLAMLMAGIIAVVTSQGVLEIRTEVDDVDLIVTRGGEEIEIKDATTGSTVRLWSGQYDVKLKGDRNDVKLESTRFTLSRLGTAIVTITRKAAAGSPQVSPVKPSENLVATFRGHGKGKEPGWPTAIRAVAISSDGKMLASGGADGVIILRELPGGQEIRRFQAHSEIGVSVQGLDFSDDGKLLLSGGRDATLAVWDVASGMELRRIQGGWETKGQFLPGTHQAVYRKGAHWLAYWDADSGKEISKSHSPIAIEHLSVSKDGEWVVTTHFEEGKARIWDLRSAKLLQTVESTAPAAALSPDKRQLFLGTRAGGNIAALWSLESNEYVPKFAKDNTLSALDALFTPDGRFTLTVGWSGSVKVRIQDAATGALVADLSDASPNDGTLDIAISQDGLYAATAGTEGNVRLWKLPKNGAADETAVPPLAEAGRLEGHTDSLDWLVYSHDGKYLFSGGGEKCLYQWDVATRKVIRRIQCEDFITGIAVLPDDKHVILTHYAGEVALWNLAEQKKIREYPKHPNHIRSLAISSDGKRILTSCGGSGGVVRLVNVENAEVLHEFTGYCAAVALSPDGRLAAHGVGHIYLWDPQTGQNIRRIEPPSFPIALAFSPDGRQLVSGRTDGLVQVWDTSTGQEKCRIDYAARIVSLRFLPDGRHFIIGGWDKTARVIELATGREVARATCDNQSASCVAVSPDGRSFASGGGMIMEKDESGKLVQRKDSDYPVRLWQLPESVWPSRTSD